MNYKIIQVSDYKKLNEENVNLKLKINELYRSEESLKENIKTNEHKIQQLKEENSMLRDKIKEQEDTQYTNFTNLLNEILKFVSFNKTFSSKENMEEINEWGEW